MARVSTEELERRASLLREAMERRGWGVMELADEVGLAHSHVSRITAGKVSGSAAVLASLARALSISLDDLLLDADTAAPAP